MPIRQKIKVRADEVLPDDTLYVELAGEEKVTIQVETSTAAPPEDPGFWLIIGEEPNGGPARFQTEQERIVRISRTV